MDGQRIGVVAVCGGDIGLDRVGHRIHTGVRDELLGHCLSQLGVDDGNVRGDLEVGDRVFDALLIIRDDGECSDLGGRAGGRGDGAEMRLLAQLGDAEHLAHILKGAVRIFVLDPHCLGSVDGRAAADGDDPIRLIVDHDLRAAHHGVNGGIRLDAVKNLDFHPGFLQVSLGSVQEAEALHGAAAHADDRSLALERLQRLKSALAMIQVTRKCKSCHFRIPPVVYFL